MSCRYTVQATRPRFHLGPYLELSYSVSSAFRTLYLRLLYKEHWSFRTLYLELLYKNTGGGSSTGIVHLTDRSGTHNGCCRETSGPCSGAGHWGTTCSPWRRHWRTAFPPRCATHESRPQASPQRTCAPGHLRGARRAALQGPVCKDAPRLLPMTF